ncbi:MAG: dicarboxylate/amino acid:cation symporter [Steroidobacteraceae bacterium]
MTATTSKPRLALHWQILLALLLAVVVGSLVGEKGQVFGITWLAIFGFVGQLFLNALKMLIVPLISSSMIIGIAGIGRSGALGRLGGRTLGLYALSGALAVIVGLTIVNLVSPGIVAGEPARNVLSLEADQERLQQSIAGRGAGDVVQILVRAIPPNVFEAASDNAQMLGLIVFSLLFGYFLTRIDEDDAQPVFRFWKGVFAVMMHITDLVMRFAPVGVFALVAQVAARSGFAAAQPLVLFALCVLGGLLFHALVTLPLLVRWLGRVSPLPLYRAVSPALLTAFSTASSSAALPVTMSCLEERAGVSNKVTSFVAPLGATINMNGTALYECAAVIFIAQAYGIDMSLAQQILVVLLALVTSIGVAGIPAASLVAIAVILQALHLPAEAMALLFVFDRPLDMARTAINVLGDSAAAVIVARSDGESWVLSDGAKEDAVT